MATTDNLLNLLSSWLTEHLGAQDKPGEWWIDADLCIEQHGVGKHATYVAAAFGRDHGCVWEREFKTAREVMEFVRARLEGE